MGPMADTHPDLSLKSFVVASHFAFEGSPDDLRTWLRKRKVGALLFVTHPLTFEQSESASVGDLETNEGTVARQTAPRRKWLVHQYMSEVIRTVRWTWLAKRKFDIYVGFDNLNCFAGLVLRSLGRVDKVAYYVIDYDPKRFQSKVLNAIYHGVDQLCVRFADETWNVSPRMEEGRVKEFGFSGGRQRVIPIGVWLDRIAATRPPKADPFSIVYFGTVTEKQGIQHMIRALPTIRSRFPQVKLNIIGGGNYLEPLRQLCASTGVDDIVTFQGRIERTEDAEKLISRGALGIALVREDE
jgi:glycosyltransferase involved in cell wall biosynthesis